MQKEAKGQKRSRRDKNFYCDISRLVAKYRDGGEISREFSRAGAGREAGNSHNFLRFTAFNKRQ
jgi:hypothetical protein